VSGNTYIQPTWPLLLKTEKVDEFLFFSLLDYWANWIQAKFHHPFLFLVTAIMLA
jgi:hypothetical protein